METITGEDLSERLIVGPHNSIETRLLKTVQALHTSNPGLGFDAYFSGDEIVWDKIIVAGFSQGGGNAGLLSMRHKLARAIFFSKAVSPVTDGDLNLSCTDHETCIAAGWELCSEEVNACVTSRPANYVTELERATPAKDSYLFIHEQEGAMYYSIEGAQAWGMDLCGERVSVDGLLAQQLQCGRILSTNAQPGQTGPDDEGGFHGSMGSDNAMAKDAMGYPVNQQALLYMMLAR